MRKPGSTEEAILSCAVKAVIAVENNRSTLDDLLDEPEYQTLRRTLSHLLLGYFKHKKAIDATLRKFISKAPETKINEEKAKLEKYTQMMEQVRERLAGLRK